MRATVIALALLVASPASSQICKDVPHVVCRVCAGDRVPLSDRFIAAQFCTVEDRAAKYATLDAGQRESAILTVLDKSDAMRFLLVWKARSGDADDQTLPIYRGVTVKEFGYDYRHQASTPAKSAAADYQYLTDWGYNVALVSTNDPYSPVLTVQEIDPRCDLSRAPVCASRRRVGAKGIE